MPGAEHKKKCTVRLCSVGAEQRLSQRQADTQQYLRKGLCELSAQLVPCRTHPIPLAREFRHAVLEFAIELLQESLLITQKKKFSITEAALHFAFWEGLRKDDSYVNNKGTATTKDNGRSSEGSGQHYRQKEDWAKTPRDKETRRESTYTGRGDTYSHTDPHTNPRTHSLTRKHREETRHFRHSHPRT